MNDEQQLWRDVQKFMNQFPGFVSIAKKIGDLGDLKTWQENEQRKLEALTQEVEKQRQAIVIEREAANSAVARVQKVAEEQTQQSIDRMNAHEMSARVTADGIVNLAREDAAKIVATAQATAKEITDGVAMMESRKTELEQQIADLMDAMLAAKNEHEATVGALAATKNQHAEFIKQIIGSG